MRYANKPININPLEMVLIILRRGMITILMSVGRMKGVNLPEAATPNRVGNNSIIIDAL